LQHKVTHYTSMIVSITAAVDLYHNISYDFPLFLSQNLPLHNEFDEDDDDDVEITNFLSRNNKVCSGKLSPRH
jgi:hypothetical protein